jgi:hypothetical protein
MPAGVGQAGSGPTAAAPTVIVRLLNVPTIAGGSRRSADGGARAATAPAMPGGVGNANGTPLIGALRGIGHVTVINPNPGTTIAAGGMRSGRLAASPSGTENASGLGRAGDGTSNDGTAGSSIGAQGIGTSGVGTGGASPTPSAGGTDAEHAGAISVSNGRIDLGSFGPNVEKPARGTRPAIVIVGSASSTATLERFTRSLRGDVYTVYLNASGTPAVLQFAERDPHRSGSFDGGVSPPESISTKLPRQAIGKQVIAGVLNSEGRLTQIHPLLASTEEATAKLVRALEQWRFVPASRNATPVDVDVVIGFGVDTN